MDQRKEPRVVITLRVRRDSKIALEKRAKADGCTPSDLHRRMLAYGMTHMPKDWGK